jgi:hypothetical protein
MTVVDEIMDTLADTIDTLNFWDRPSQVTTLEGKLNKVFILSKVKALIMNKAQLTTDVMDLAKRRESDILAKANTSKAKAQEADA